MYLLSVRFELTISFASFKPVYLHQLLYHQSYNEL